MYKNMQLPLGEMNFLKDFVNDTRGDLYPIVEKSEGCQERVGENRYHVESGSAERVFCQFFPFATYEIEAERVCGEIGFVFRLPEASATVALVSNGGKTALSYRCGEHTEELELPESFTADSPWLVTCRPGFFDIYYRQNGGAVYFTLEETDANVIVSISYGKDRTEILTEEYGEYMFTMPDTVNESETITITVYKLA